MQGTACRKDAGRVDQYTKTDSILQSLNGSVASSIAHIEILQGLALQQVPPAIFHISSLLRYGGAQDERIECIGYMVYLWYIGDEDGGGFLVPSFHRSVIKRKSWQCQATNKRGRVECVVEGGVL